MTLRFPKDILISCAIHILCVAGLLMSGFNPTDHAKNIPHIEPNEMVFTIETAAAIVPVVARVHVSPKVLKPAPAPKPKTVQKKKAIKKSVKKSVKKAVKPKQIVKKVIKKQKPVVKKVAQKSVKPTLNTASKSISKQPSSQNILSPTHATGKATSKSTQNPTTSGTTKFNKNYYIAQIKKHITQFKHYPNSARRRGIEGRVGLQISVSKMGTITSLHIIKPSGSRILDKAAIKSVRKAVPFQKMAQAITFHFAIRYNFDDV